MFCGILLHCRLVFPMKFYKSNLVKLQRNSVNQLRNHIRLSRSLHSNECCWSVIYERKPLWQRNSIKTHRLLLVFHSDANQNTADRRRRCDMRTYRTFSNQPNPIRNTINTMITARSRGSNNRGLILANLRIAPDLIYGFANKILVG